jgi:HEPN domain-containing protein
MTGPPDDNEETNSMGLFNTAEAYLLSAMALESVKVASGHAAKPILFCYYHALELFLKALLRQKHSVETLSKKFGHDIKRLIKEAEALGLGITDKDREVVAMIDIDATMDVRYIRTGPKKRWPRPDELRHTCRPVGINVGILLRKADVPVKF